MAGDGYAFIAPPMENAYLRSHVNVLRLNQHHSQWWFPRMFVDQLDWYHS